MTPTRSTVPDSAVFQCCFCNSAMAVEDFIDLKMRLPEPGETPEEYRDSELIDELRHMRCPPGDSPAA